LKHPEKRTFFSETYKKSEILHAMQEAKENTSINVKAMERLEMGWGEVMLSLVNG